LSFSRDAATLALSTLSLHDALPICDGREDVEPGNRGGLPPQDPEADQVDPVDARRALLPDVAVQPLPVLHAEHRRGPEALIDPEDRKSTRLNSSHVKISYAVFCLKK